MLNFAKMDLFFSGANHEHKKISTHYHYVYINFEEPFATNPYNFSLTCIAFELSMIPIFPLIHNTIQDTVLCHVINVIFVYLFSQHHFFSFNDLKVNMPAACCKRQSDINGIV